MKILLAEGRRSPKGLSYTRDARVSIRFADDREFETLGNYRVNQWPQVRHDPELDLCFGVSREQVTYRCNRYGYHAASRNPVASISELERKGRRVELVSEESTVPNPIQPACLYRVQSLRSAGSQKRRTLLSNGLAEPTAARRAIPRNQ